MFKQYDVSTFFPPLGYRQDHNPMSRLRNILVEALNEKVKLPAIIVISLDHTFLEAFDDKKECKRIIAWLMREFKRAIKTRKDQLPEKAFDNKGPKFLWLKTLPVIKNLETNLKSNHKRRIFNKCLDQSVGNDQNMGAGNVDTIIPFQRSQFNYAIHSLKQDPFMMISKEITTSEAIPLEAEDEFLTTKDLSKTMVVQEAELEITQEQ